MFELIDLYGIVFKYLKVVFMGMATVLWIGDSVGSLSFAGSATGAYQFRSEPRPVPAFLL